METINKKVLTLDRKLYIIYTTYWAGVPSRHTPGAESCPYPWNGSVHVACETLFHILFQSNDDGTIFLG